MRRMLALAAMLLSLGLADAGRAQARDPFTDQLDRARQLRVTGNGAGSRQIIDRVLAADPTSTRAWHSLGLIHLDAGRSAEALAALRRGADLLDRDRTREGPPRFPDYSLYNTYGWALMLAGRTGEAETYLRRAYERLDKLPTNEARLKVLNNLGYLYLQTGRPREAILLLERAVAGGSSRATLNLAKARRQASTPMAR